MLETNTNKGHEQKMSQRGELARKLDAAGWALFFIWVGIALLADVGWGIGLLGIGVITFIMQGARRYFDMKLEGFWIVVGFLFFLGGIWELFRVEISLVPVLLIAAGIALLVSIVRGSNKKE